jgi:arginine exporter protein ArgO
MKTATYIYIGFYLLFAAWVIASEIKDKDPLWDTASDIILLSLGFIGMMFFQFEVTAPTIKLLWKGVSILIIIGQIFLNLYTRHQTLSGETELELKEMPKWAVMAADWTVIIALLPMFVLNIWFAYS